MNIQNYVLSILYTILIVGHLFTLCHKDYYHGLISIFSFALFAETAWTISVTIHKLAEQHGHEPKDLTTAIHRNSIENFQYNAQFIHIIAINFFILFLLIVAKGWPITRRNMPFKYAFSIFWLLCLCADLITFYWTTLSNILSTTEDQVSNNSSMHELHQLNALTISPPSNLTIISVNETNHSIAIPVHDNFNTTSHKLNLLIRIVIMIYFLLELRTTMILEQEKKKLQFYLHFGASTMVWLVHTVIVYMISLRVDENWRLELVSGCSAVANFIGFAVATILLWPKNSRSYLFRKHEGRPNDSVADYSAERCEIDKFFTVIQEDDVEVEDELGGEPGSEYHELEMRDLSKPKQP